MKFAHFTRDRIEAIRDLVDLWGRDKIVLVGATALACSVDMTWRQTHDLDLSVAIAMEDYPAGLDGLPGWARSKTREHEWTSPRGVRVDIIPAGDDHLADASVTWPGSGLEMSLVGMRLAFRHATPVPVSQNLELPVATAASIAVLKVVAYLDRPAERAKDLADIAHLLESYHLEGDERFSEDVPGGDVDFEDAGAFLLGRDVGAIIGHEERSVVEEFLARVRSDDDPVATQARLLQLGPPEWMRESSVLKSRLAAFELGLGGSGIDVPPGRKTASRFRG